MHPDGDDVILTDHERAELARIEATLASSSRRGRFARRRSQLWMWPLTAPLRLACVLVLAGAVMTTASFTRSLWLASVGLVLMGAGIAVAAQPGAVRLRRLIERRLTNRGATSR